MPWRRILLAIICTIAYCEFLGDFHKLSACQWPSLSDKDDAKFPPLKAMIIADTHLLGPHRGHWLDKLYREWHMRRAYQAALLLHKPNVIFVLGDLFDEGDLVEHEDFRNYVLRFQRHFHAPPDVPVISAVGNHDVGFHYRMHPYFMDRFEQQYNNTGVELYTLQGNHFVFINSMAMENDGCEFCETAIQQLDQVAAKLKCLKYPSTCLDASVLQQHKHFSRPVILQHFPTYRKSDASCREHDTQDIEEYRETWEVLSKNATDWLGKVLRPRLAFAGHSHNYCYSINRWGIEEYTVASFSWRNKVNPSFVMLTITPTAHAVFKCHMLEQQTVYNLYTAVAIVCSISIIWQIIASLRKRWKTKVN